MKFSENWLREWVDPAIDSDTLCTQLTMAGLEVDSVAPAGPALAQVVVARIASVTAHPDADNLRVCTVEAGQDAPLQIVCGAANAAAGLTAPLALVGAQLPGGTTVQAADIRGVGSQGMLCSAAELGLGEAADGLLDLDPDVAPGTPLAAHLRLDDRIIEIDLTPNRGDCLSLRGVAREVGVWNRCAVTPVTSEPQPATTEQTITVKIDDAGACPAYAGRVIRGIDPAARTPDWMRERLRRGGIRPRAAVVDVTNYVMLELGQPMHAFDYERLQGSICVRFAGLGEWLDLLDGGEVALASDALVIADDSGPVALAGVMGGAATAVTDATETVFLESACFAPTAMAGQGRRYKRHTDALHRFERGVDPVLQNAAIERATALILMIAGGQAGPVSAAAGDAPVRPRIPLRHARIERLLGSAVAVDEVTDILQRLDMQVTSDGDAAWTVVPPGFRFDLAREADLIEEVARIHGYDRLPSRPRRIRAQLGGLPETRLPREALREVLRQRGYHEAITYSFVDAALQARLDPDSVAMDLDNPIAEQYAQMRTTLWASLLPAWLYNVRRQQPRVRLFETGLRFTRDSRAIMGISQQAVIAGVVSGPAAPEQWGSETRGVDFHDLKGDVEALLALAGGNRNYSFEAAAHPALHPSRSARLLLDGAPVGWLGQLHPELEEYKINNELPYLFEIDYNVVNTTDLPRYTPVSEFPQVRRDLSFAVPENVTAGALLEAVDAAAIKHLQDARIFDVFRGKGLETGFKSLALGLIFQNKFSTLTDEEVDESVARLADELARRSGASVRRR